MGEGPTHPRSALIRGLGGAISSLESGMINGFFKLGEGPILRYKGVSFGYAERADRGSGIGGGKRRSCVGGESHLALFNLEAQGLAGLWYFLGIWSLFTGEFGLRRILVLLWYIS